MKRGGARSPPPINPTRRKRCDATALRRPPVRSALLRSRDDTHWWEFTTCKAHSLRPFAEALSLRATLRLQHVVRPCVAACAALACDSNTGPRLPFIPPLGTYTYTFTHPADANGIIAARSFSGTLVLTYATADSIAGRWEVSGYASQPFDGARGLDVRLCLPDLCSAPAPAPGPQPA